MRMDPDQQLAHLTSALNLTTDQQSQIKPLLSIASRRCRHSCRTNLLSQDDRRAQARTISQGTNNSIKALLTDEQKQKFDAMQANMRHGGPRRRTPPPPAGQPKSSTPELNRQKRRDS